MKFSPDRVKEILSFWFGEDISHDEEVVLKERVEHFWFTENKKTGPTDKEKIQTGFRGYYRQYSG